MKISLLFTHSEVILVYTTFFFQTNTIRVLVKKKCPGSSKLYNGSELLTPIHDKSESIHHKSASVHHKVHLSMIKVNLSIIKVHLSIISASIWIDLMDFKKTPIHPI